MCIRDRHSTARSRKREQNSNKSKDYTPVSYTHLLPKSLVYDRQGVTTFVLIFCFAISAQNTPLPLPISIHFVMFPAYMER